MYHPRRDESEHGVGIFALKGAAVDALLVGRVLLMRSDLDTVERAVVLVTAVILAVLNAAMDTMVHLCFVQHHFHLNINLSAIRPDYYRQITPRYAQKQTIPI